MKRDPNDSSRWFDEYNQEYKESFLNHRSVLCAEDEILFQMILLQNWNWKIEPDRSKDRTNTGSAIFTSLILNKIFILFNIVRDNGRMCVVLPRGKFAIKKHFV